MPDARGRFGAYGGRYAPEVLIPALDELDVGVDVVCATTPCSATSSPTLARDFVGRPTPITHAARLSAELGYDVWLKREDLAHTGAHKINNALGQALLAKRLGKERIIAETGAGQHGVATATACALLGSALRRVHGRGGHPSSGAERRSDAAAGRRGRARDRRVAHPEGGRERGAP